MLSVLTDLFKSWQSIIFTGSHDEQLKYDGIVFICELFNTLAALSNLSSVLHSLYVLIIDKQGCKM